MAGTKLGRSTKRPRSGSTIGSSRLPSTTFIRTNAERAPPIGQRCAFRTAANTRSLGTLLPTPKSQAFARPADTSNAGCAEELVRVRTCTKQGVDMGRVVRAVVLGLAIGTFCLPVPARAAA